MAECRVGLRVPPPARPVGLGPDPPRDAPRLHGGRRYLAQIDAPPRAGAGRGALHGHHRGVSRARREADFEATCALMERVRYDSAFVFKYSPRPGTEAAGWPDDVPQPDKERRNQTILEIQARISREKLEAWVGGNVEVLVEERNRRGQLAGKSRGNTTVVFEGPDAAHRRAGPRPRRSRHRHDDDRRAGGPRRAGALIGLRNPPVPSLLSMPDFVSRVRQLTAPAVQVDAAAAVPRGPPDRAGLPRALRPVRGGTLHASSRLQGRGGGAPRAVLAARQPRADPRARGGAVLGARRARTAALHRATGSWPGARSAWRPSGNLSTAGRATSTAPRTSTPWRPWARTR